MKTFLKILAVALCAITFLLSLPYILTPRDFPKYTDEELKNRALSRGLVPIPIEEKAQVKLINPNNDVLFKQKAKLGKALFFDPILSQNNQTSCFSCHMIKQKKEQKPLQEALLGSQKVSTCVACHLKEQSGTDRSQTAIGYLGEEHKQHINTTTVLNVSLAKYFTWSGEISSLKEHIKKTLFSPFKLGLTPESLKEKLSQNSTYQKLFQEAFKSSDSITLNNTLIALESYIRTLLTISDYDRFLLGESNAISAKAKQGLANFINFGCKGCHTGITVGGQNLQRFPLRRNITVNDFRPNITFEPHFSIINLDFPFENKGNFYGDKITNKFRVPILRNVTKTSPYFHNGSVAKIDEAVRIMARHQLGLVLTQTQIEQIVAFLKTLEGEPIEYSNNL